ncbi:MAG TPA: DUF3418 domain-containing protein [Phycisphaerales bacterium]|nr:DUF3418 domain-containing protein [Phycisphaerales bacterium]HMP38069.1 DUF3418 domain-containing protein [Phycisphaerales bacterium]
MKLDRRGDPSPPPRDSPRSGAAPQAARALRLPEAPFDLGALHRCILAGFPTQIGRLVEERRGAEGGPGSGGRGSGPAARPQRGVYEGPRGLRFSIASGSALFRQEAPWVVAAELVETSRLFARTAGRIRADWVERVAPHLVRREYFEPHWRRDAGQVAAYERVTLHGLVLVPKRRIAFGPIDPRAARDIFIHAALVDEQIRTDGEFLAANRELVETIERVEAKRRQRDLLLDAAARFEFYDRRIPADIHSTPSFEKWRRAVEARTPALLHMTRADLLRPGAGEAAAEEFPDAIEVGGLRVPLDYRHEPGEEEDGVAATIPLAALPRIDAEALEWLVPGMLREKIVALLRTLPKRLRVRFVPAAEFAEGAAESVPFGEGSLVERLAEHLRRLTGTPIVGADFRPAELPAHLRMFLRVIDDRGAVVAAGRDLAALRRSLRERREQGPEETPPRRSLRSPRDGLGDSDSAGAGAGAPEAADALDGVPARMTTFAVDRLPELIERVHGGMSVPAHPALVDLGDAVGVGLFATAAEAERAQRFAVRRLAAIAMAPTLRPLVEYLPAPDGSIGIAGMRLLAAPWEGGERFEQELIERIAERAVLGDDPPPRSREAFEAALRRSGGERGTGLWEIAREVVGLAWSILGLRQALVAALDQPLPSTWEESAADLRRCVEALLPRGFFSDLPWARLVHLPRYLAAAQARLARLRTHGHARDLELMSEIRRFERLWEERAAALHGSGRTTPELDAFRWLIEEYRVSLHAPQLRTAVPISSVRLERHWARVERS